MKLLRVVNKFHDFLTFSFTLDLRYDIIDLSNHLLGEIKCQITNQIIYRP